MAFQPTDEQIQIVFQNRLENEPPIDNMFTGFLGFNCQAYIIYYIMNQQKKINSIVSNIELITNQSNTIQQQAQTINDLQEQVKTLQNQIEQILLRLSPINV